MAEAMFQHKATLRGAAGHFKIDSAGTGGWHAGDPPDARMRRTARRNGITLDGVARQIKPRDFSSFELIICMDGENHENLLSMGAPVDQLVKMLDYHPDPDWEDVPDPYYGGGDGFQEVFDLLDTACEALLDSLLETDR